MAIFPTKSIILSNCVASLNFLSFVFPFGHFINHDTLCRYHGIIRKNNEFYERSRDITSFYEILRDFTGDDGISREITIIHGRSSLRGVQASQLGKLDFEIWVEGEGQDMSQHFGDVFGSLRAILPM